MTVKQLSRICDYRVMQIWNKNNVYEVDVRNIISVYTRIEQLPKEIQNAKIIQIHPIDTFVIGLRIQD